MRTRPLTGVTSLGVQDATARILVQVNTANEPFLEAKWEQDVQGRWQQFRRRSNSPWWTQTEHAPCETVDEALEAAEYFFHSEQTRAPHCKDSTGPILSG